MQHHKTVDFKDASVVVSGTYKGKPATFTADVANFEFEYDSDYPDTTYWEDKGICVHPFALWEEYVAKLTLKRDDKGRYGKIKVMGTVKVARTARILSDDRTVAALEQARVRAGAPENAKYRYSESQRFTEGELTVHPWDEPRPVQVEFYWEEEV